MSTKLLYLCSSKDVFRDEIYGTFHGFRVYAQSGARSPCAVVNPVCLFWRKALLSLVVRIHLESKPLATLYLSLEHVVKDSGDANCHKYAHNIDA